MCVGLLKENKRVESYPGPVGSWLMAYDKAGPPKLVQYDPENRTRVALSSGQF